MVYSHSEGFWCKRISQDINQTCAKLPWPVPTRQRPEHQWEMGHICNQIQCWSCFELLGANISRILGPSKVQAKQHHNIRPHVGQRKVYLSPSLTTTVKWKRNEQRWTKYIKHCRLITLRFYMFHALNWNNPNVSQCLFQFRNNLCSFFMGHLWLAPWS